VVDEAIRYADAGGLESLSMPKLAQHLGVGTMTLYGYVANKRDLLDRMAARLFEVIRIPAAATWQDQMRAYMTQVRSAAIEHPALPELLSTVRIDLTPIAEDLEGLLAGMQRSGISPRESLRVFDAAFAYTVGFVMWESPARGATMSPLAQWRGFVADSGSATYAALARSVAADDGEGRFEAGLDRMLAAVGASAD
jgi:AcrR family transcriptional regulator